MAWTYQYLTSSESMTDLGNQCTNALNGLTPAEGFSAKIVFFENNLWAALFYQQDAPASPPHATSLGDAWTGTYVSTTQYDPIVLLTTFVNFLNNPNNQLTPAQLYWSQLTSAWNADVPNYGIGLIIRQIN